MSVKLDYSLRTPQERKEYIEKLLQEKREIPYNTKELDYMSNYLLFISEKDQTKKERKEEKPIVTRNRQSTVGKRQISYEGVIEGLENGEDGLHTLIRNDKNQILDPKDPISQRDIEEIPGMREHMDMIEKLNDQLIRAVDKNKRWLLKRSIIETGQQAYMLKSSWRGFTGRAKPTSRIKTLVHTDIPEKILFDENQIPYSLSILSLLNPTHVTFLLCYYSQLKEECYDELYSDIHFLLLDLENLVDAALMQKYPLLYDIVIGKIDGLTNEEIQKAVDAKYGEGHTEQYYSSVGRKRIPKLIVEEAQKQYLTGYYTNVEKGYGKKCTKCGEVKLGHQLFYPRNTSSDGWYSQCKDCKNASRKK